MRNAFSIYLKELLKNSNIKYVNIANATGYDLSYVSKWLSGSMLPSEKTIASTVEVVSDCIVKGISKDNTQWYIEKYGTADTDAIKASICKELLQQYAISKGNLQEKEYIFSNKLGTELLTDYIVTSIEQENNIAAIIDFFSLDRYSQLRIAGIKDGCFYRDKCSLERKIAFIVNTSKLIYNQFDAIFFIHLLSGLSVYDYMMYDSNIASGKIIFAVRDKMVITGFFLGHSDDISAVSIIKGYGECSDIYFQIMQNKVERNPIYVKRSMLDFIGSNDYIKTLMSTNINWIQGHVTEFMLPEELFQRYSKSINYDENVINKLFTVYTEVISSESARVLLYESAISDFVATGVVDFFNTKIHLDKTEKQKVLVHLMSLISKSNLRLIEGVFYPEFEHLYSPNLYISDSSVYLRLENAYNRDCVFQLVGSKIKALMRQLFDDLWENRTDVVISNKKDIANYFKRFTGINKAIPS